MTGLLVVVLLFWWVHTFLWWRKAYWEKQRQLAAGHLISEKLSHVDRPGETYLRFKVRDRVLHLVSSAILIHRICALVLIVAFLVVLGYCVHFTLLQQEGRAQLEGAPLQPLFPISAEEGLGGLHGDAQMVR